MKQLFFIHIKSELRSFYSTVLDFQEGSSEYWDVGIWMGMKMETIVYS
jgi:hypothetical protein